VVAGQSRSFLGSGALPGSITLTINGGVYSDDSKGGFNFVSGSNTFTKITVDYQTGELNAYRATTYTGAASVTYTPAAAVTGPAITGEIVIGLANRGYAYTLNLADAKPKPGTLTISFMALGKWYDLTDPGNGELTGQGSGTVAFGTGSVSFTLEALPDVDSAIIYSYVASNAAEFTQRVGGAVAAKARIKHRLPHDGILPGSVTATYLVGGVTKTITDNSAGGLTGQASGTIVYATGELGMELASTPDAGSSIGYSYQQGEASAGSQVLTPAPDGAGTVTGTIAGAPLQPGSVQASWSVIRKRSIPSVAQQASHEENQILAVSARDDGTGGWVGYSGTINYTTGEFTLRVRGDYTFIEYTYVR
jgi:hypothetical protein